MYLPGIIITITKEQEGKLIMKNNKYFVILIFLEFLLLGSLLSCVSTLNKETFEFWWPDPESQLRLIMDGQTIRPEIDPRENKKKSSFGARIDNNIIIVYAYKDVFWSYDSEKKELSKYKYIIDKKQDSGGNKTPKEPDAVPELDDNKTPEEPGAVPEYEVKLTTAPIIKEGIDKIIQNDDDGFFYMKGKELYKIVNDNDPDLVYTDNEDVIDDFIVLNKSESNLLFKAIEKDKTAYIETILENADNYDGVELRTKLYHYAEWSNLIKGKSQEDGETLDEVEKNVSDLITSYKTIRDQLSKDWGVKFNAETAVVRAPGIDEAIAAVEEEGPAKLVKYKKDPLFLYSDTLAGFRDGHKDEDALKELPELIPLLNDQIQEIEGILNQRISDEFKTDVHTIKTQTETKAGDLRDLIETYGGNHNGGPAKQTKVFDHGNLANNARIGIGRFADDLLVLFISKPGILIKPDKTKERIINNRKVEGVNMVNIGIQGPYVVLIDGDRVNIINVVNGETTQEDLKDGEKIFTPVGISKNDKGEYRILGWDGSISKPFSIPTRF
jgi:hypothetical protein